GELRLARLARRSGFRGGAAAAIKGLLLIVPSSALGMIDRAVMIGVDLVEARAEAAVAIGLGQPGEPIVIRFRLLEPGALARLKIGDSELRGELGLTAFDVAQPPLAVLLEGDRVVSPRQRGGLGLIRGSRLRRLAGHP